MKTRTASIAFAFTVLLGVFANANEEPKKQTHCPVMENYEIVEGNHVDVNGYRIHTCCKGCINQIKANPEKYIQRLQDQGVEIERSPIESKPQTVCPVMGGKINKAQYTDVKGYRIYVCCPGCIDKIKADPNTYIEKMKAEGIEPEKVAGSGKKDK